MASSVCKSHPPKARKRIIVGLPAKQGTANCSIITSPSSSCDSEAGNDGILVSAAGNDAHDCIVESTKASSVLAKSALIAANADAAKANSTETDSNKRTRKRKSVTDAVDLPSKSVKAKKEKDPNEPKRPPPAFFLFMEEFRTNFKKANPNAKGAQVSKEGGDKWKSMSDEAKEPFVKKCNDMKEEYQKALQIYKSNGKESIESTITDNTEEKCDVDIESREETAISADHTTTEIVVGQ